MELYEVIKKRRSVRRFDIKKNVTEEQIKKILEAAILAPSSGNTQCWHFVVVRNEKLKERLSKDAGHQPFIAEVPVVIVVCADHERSSLYGERGVVTYSLQDTAAAIQNILLTVTDMGLAACWIGSFDESGASEILDLPKSIRPLAMLPIGYPAESPSMPKRKPLESVTEWK